MKGLAFALDPNGYWIEIISRGSLLNKNNSDEPKSPIIQDHPYTLCQSMIRVKDIEKSLRFYRLVFAFFFLVRFLS